MSVLVTAWMLVFARVAGLLATMPVLGAAGVPALARLGAAVPLAVLLLPVGGSVVVPETLSALLGALILEMLLGTAMGFCMQVAFSALGVAADLTSSQAGLSMGAMFDPVSMSQPGAIGALANWLGTGVFLGAGLHLNCIQALGQSFRDVPVGTVADITASGAAIAMLVGAMIATAVQLAAPLTLFVFAVNLALALIGRMAPGVQILQTIGTTIQVIVALALLGPTLPRMLEAWLDWMPQGLDALLLTLRLAAG